MAMYGTIRPACEPLTVDGQVEKHFLGRRAGWQKTYRQLLAKVEKLGTDVTVQPANSYISLVRQGRKFAIVKVSANRFDIGIKLKGIDPCDRLTPAGTWNAMVTHRVGLENPEQIDAELLSWLRLAYDRA
jgi:hypothetical protein